MRIMGSNPENSDEWRIDVLSIIEEVQADRHGRGTSSIDVKIGGTNPNNDIVQHDKIYIKNCPAKLTNVLQTEGYSLSMTEQGMKVHQPY